MHASTSAPRSPVPAALGDRVMPLSAATGGQVYEVADVGGDDALTRRLAAAGVWPGARIECIARAPFGDPLLFRLHGYRLALRRSEADRVLVRAAPGTGEIE